MNYDRVDVSHVNDPASLATAEAGVLQLAGFTVTTEQVSGWLVKAINADGEVAVSQLLLPNPPPPAPKYFVLDTFSGPDMPLGEHVGEIGASWPNDDFSVVSQGELSPTDAEHIPSGTPLTTDYRVVAKLRFNGPLNYLVQCRGRVDGANYYAASLAIESGVHKVRLCKVIRGVQTDFGEFVSPNPVVQLELSCAGTKLTAKANDVPVVSAVDPDLYLPGKATLFTGEGPNEGAVAVESFFGEYVQ